MYDLEVVYLIEGIDIDRPFNAITLTQDMHDSFGRFDIFFESVYGPGTDDHTYRINAFDPDLVSFSLPITRTLYNADPNIDMPSARLLALHSAIGHILHLSGGGRYIDSLFREMEDLCARSDGSTRFDDMVRLRLGGWWDGMVNE